MAILRPSPSTDLIAEHAADDCADDGARDLFLILRFARVCDSNVFAHLTGSLLRLHDGLHVQYLREPRLGHGLVAGKYAAGSCHRRARNPHPVNNDLFIHCSSCGSKSHRGGFSVAIRC